MASFEQPDLLSVEKPELPTHRNDPPASHVAAANARENAYTQQLSVLEYLEAAGRRGATAQEIDFARHWGTPSGSPAGRRLSHLLRTKPPQVVRLLETRVNGSGSPAHVHVLPSFVDGRPTLGVR